MVEYSSKIIASEEKEKKERKHHHITHCSKLTYCRPQEEVFGRFTATPDIRDDHTSTSIPSEGSSVQLNFYRHAVLSPI